MAVQGEVRKPGAIGIVHVASWVGWAGSAMEGTLAVVDRVWRRAGQGCGLRFKFPSLYYCPAYSQPVGSSDCQQQGIMGFVVFSVTGRGQGCLEMH